MNHLIISREYPPAAYAHGGIGTYVQQIARLLAERGETVHVIAEQWDRAPKAVESLHGGRLVVHRVPLARPRDLRAGERHPADVCETLEAMAASEFPAQGFAWQAALLAESLIDPAAIDVIEGQDFEAPLYYLLLRRAVGLGPNRQPPCVVHLHGPWELVCRANGWGLASAYDLTVARLEAYTIRAADALLCPSRYLANQVSVHYGVARDSIERIPYPIGDTPLTDRMPDVWQGGTILYIGRMEPRKGVLEWIEAAVAMAAERPTLRFEFVGADTTLNGQDDGPSVRAEVERRVPLDLSAAFSFHEAEPRTALWARLARAQLVVVPSRWDNFPHTAIEAMCSGLPVLASPEGGMAEVIEDGRTGWLAASNRPDDLLAALRRALDTPVEVRSRMGRAAVDAVQALCNNTVTVDRHLAFRQRVMTAGAGRSLQVPETGGAALRGVSTGPPGPRTLTETTPAASRPSDARGIAVVVTDASGVGLAGCLSSLARQTRPPVDVVVVPGPRGLEDERWSAGALQQRGWRVTKDPGRPDSGVRALALQRVLDAPAAPLGVAVVDAACRLAPEFVEASATALQRNARVGLVSSWSADGGAWQRTTVTPCPALPYQWVMNDLGGCCTIRTTALREVGWMPEVIGGDVSPADWALAILAGGWRAVTYPALLSWRVNGAVADSVARRQSTGARVRAALIDRWPELGVELADWQPFLESHVTRASRSVRSERGSFTPETVLREPFRAQMRLLGRALRNPHYAAAWVGWHSRRAWRGALRRLRGSRAEP